jgi:hypothetical protein
MPTTDVVERALQDSSGGWPQHSMTLYRAGRAAVAAEQNPPELQQMQQLYRMLMPACNSRHISKLYTGATAALAASLATFQGRSMPGPTYVCRS